MFISHYLQIKESILKKRIESLNTLLNKCTLCPNECKINRNKGEKGKCNTNNKCYFYCKKDGLNIPIMYNTFGYEKRETLKMLDGIIDIYMHNIRYSSNEYGDKNYLDFNRDAIKEMYRQVGDLIIEDGVGKKGLLVRLLKDLYDL